MFVKLFTLADLAILAAADFKMFFYAENSFGDPGIGIQTNTGFKFFTSSPDCSGFINGKALSPRFENDVSGDKGGSACDGCDANKNWKDWRPSRVELNDSPRPNVFKSEPYHITLYGTGNGNYDIHDTTDNIIGQCSMVDKPQEVECGTVWGPYQGLEFVNCITDLTV